LRSLQGNAKQNLNTGTTPAKVFVMAIGFVLFSVANSKAPGDVSVSCCTMALARSRLALRWTGGPHFTNAPKGGLHLQSGWQNGTVLAIAD
jgi:hypothetical protein